MCNGTCRYYMQSQVFFATDYIISPAILSKGPRWYLVPPIRGTVSARMAESATNWNKTRTGFMLIAKWQIGYINGRNFVTFAPCHLDIPAEPDTRCLARKALPGSRAYASIPYGAHGLGPLPAYSWGLAPRYGTSDHFIKPIKLLAYV